MLERLHVIDVGARYGLHPSLRPLLGRADIDLFEPEPEEFQRLVEQYRHSPRVVVHQIAIGRESNARQFELRQHRALSGFADLRTKRVEEQHDRVGIVGTAPERLTEVSVTGLDTFLKGDLTFLKVDCEGSESEVIESAGDRQSCIIAIRVAVNHRPLWRGDSTFAEMDMRLQHWGFDYIRSEFALNNYEYGELPLPDSTAMPWSCDGIWVRNSALRSSRAEHVAAALFLYMHDAHGLALQALLAATEIEHLHLEIASLDDAEGLLYAYLIRHLLIARTLPHWHASQIDDYYGKVCGAKFPNRQRAFEVLNAVGLSV
jgi:FkbM family methyltransferase